MTEKLYGIEMWDDLDDIGVSYMTDELYRTREAAEKAASELRGTDEHGYRSYAEVREFEVVEE